MVIEFQLQRIMDEKGLTYRSVSAGAGVSTNTLYKIAKNKIKMIGVDVIDRLCKFLEISPGELITRKED